MSEALRPRVSAAGRLCPRRVERSVHQTSRPAYLHHLGAIVRPSRDGADLQRLLSCEQWPNRAQIGGLHVQAPADGDLRSQD
jgi:hypothetical protein